MNGPVRRLVVGVHSPFAFALITRVINERWGFYCYDDIELIRRQLVHKGSTGVRREIKCSHGQLLFRVVNYFKPRKLIQFGSPAGIGTLYMASYASGLHCLVLEENEEFITDFISAVEANAEWIASDGVVMPDIVAAINANYGGAISSLTANNLNSAVISRCAIEFVSASECRQEITEFIGKLEVLTGTSLTISDSFFYNAD